MGCGSYNNFVLAEVYRVIVTSGCWSISKEGGVVRSENYQ
jgi:hypothetical protein